MKENQIDINETKEVNKIKYNKTIEQSEKFLSDHSK